MVLDIILCVILFGLICYFIYSIVKKLKARKAMKQKKDDNEPIIVEPLEEDEKKEDQQIDE